MKRFGVSTHLYHEERLQQAHLLEIAANGFEAVEVFATRSHFDYHDPAAIRALKEWLAEARLDLHSVHAPITDVFANGRAQRTFSTALRDNDARKATLHEMEAALNIAKTIPFKFFVVHLGVPDAQHPGPDDNNREAAIRSVEEIHGMADAVGVKVALEVMGNSLSTAPDLVEMLERTFRGRRPGHLHGRRPRAHPRGHGRSHRDDVGISGHDAHSRQSAAAATTISSHFRAASTGPPPSWRSRRSATMEC